MGESSGGGIAIGMLMRDKELNQGVSRVARMILIYSMLDDRNTTTDPELDRKLIWRYQDNETGWTALLGKDVIGTDHVSPYAAPARATDEMLRGLPECYMHLGGIDIFVKEDAEMAIRLQKVGVQTEFHVWPGLVHGWEASPAKETEIAELARKCLNRSIDLI